MWRTATYALTIMWCGHVLLHQFHVNSFTGWCSGGVKIFKRPSRSGQTRFVSCSYALLRVRCHWSPVPKMKLGAGWGSCAEWMSERTTDTGLSAVWGEGWMASEGGV